MRPRRQFLPLLIVSLILAAVYIWTLTESVTVTLQVSDGRCTAHLYGRTSALLCPGLKGGSLFTIVEAAEYDRQAHGLRGPLALLANAFAPKWDRFEIFDADGQRLPVSDPLPETFMVNGHLRRPNETAGIVLARFDDGSGWAFIPDGATRRGIWWRWEDGQLSAPIQGIPLDKPFVAQAQSFARLLLSSWQGAILCLLVTALVGIIAAKITTRKLSIRLEPHSRIFLACFCLFTFAVTLHISTVVLERIPHIQDSVTYLFQAQTLARGQLTAPAPPLAGSDETRHFGQEFLLVRDGRWFGKYPIGYPALLAIGVMIGAYWLVNPLLATLTIPLIFVLARSLFPKAGERAASSEEVWWRSVASEYVVVDYANWILPTLLLSLSPFFLIMSGSLMAHAAELFWSTLFMLAWAKALPQGRSRWSMVAGLAIGALFLTRQFTAVTVALAFGGGLSAAYLFEERAIRQTSRPDNNRARSLTRAAVLCVVTTAPFVLGFFAYQSAVTGDPWSDPRLLYWPYDRVGFGRGYGESENVFTFVSTSAGIAQQWSEDPDQPPRGNTPSLGLYNLGRNFNALEEVLFGWPPLVSLSFLWLAFLLRRPAAADWVLLFVIVAVAAGYVGYWAAGIAYGPRYFYAALPALVILTARGMTALAAAVGRGPMLIVAAGLLCAGLWTLPTRVESYRGYNFVSGEARRAVESSVDTPVLVFVTASDLDWWEYGAFFSGNTPWLDGNVVYARDLGSAENARLQAEFPDRQVYYWRNGVLRSITESP